MKLWFLALAFLTACATGSGPGGAPSATGDLPANLESAVNSAYRSPENKARDGARHPLETLQFFGVEPGMTVVEIAPGAGWYTEILAPYLSAKGTYYSAAPWNSDSPYMVKNIEKFNAWAARHPEVKINRTNFNPPAELEIAPEGSADMVLTFRNVHNWSSKGNEDKVFAAFYKALKPDGILGVEEHRANADRPKDLSAKDGYLREIDVVKMAEKAGFTLVGRSDINAHPKDTKDHPQGVWTLPPTLRLGAQDREKYIAIGESDRMTLKFKKLAKLPKEARKKKRRSR